MKNFQKLIPVAAILISLSPLAASASSYRSVAHPTVSHSATTESQMLAANSKGRPGEFSTASPQNADFTVIYSAATPPNKDGSPIPNGN